MGPVVRAELERPGFYPAGGGSVVLRLEPAAHLAPIRLLDRGEIRHRRARALVARLPRRVAEREVGVLKERLGWPEDCFEVEEVEGSRGPGNVVMIEMGDGHLTEVFTGFGSRGVPAERVAEQAAAAALRWLESGVPVGEHLADQLMLPLAQAGSGTYRTHDLTSHSRTNLEVIGGFLDLEISTRTEPDGACTVRFGTPSEE